MTPEAQRIAIAEACGYVWYAFQDPDGKEFAHLIRTDKNWPQRQGGVRCERPPEFESEAPNVPDYLYDLNAMADAEETISTLDIGKYVAELAKVLNEGVAQSLPVLWASAYYLIHATAKQRAEAFLKTKGLWKDEG